MGGVANTVKSTLNFVFKPVVNYIIKPAFNYVIKPAYNFVIKPVIKPVYNYVIKPAYNFVIKPVIKPVFKYVIKPLTKYIIAPIWNTFIEPIWEVVTFPVRLIVSSFSFNAFETKGTERLPGKPKQNARIISFRVYKCFVGDDIISYLASALTKVLFNRAIMHWWVELKTEDGDYYIAHFNHPFGYNYNQMILDECSDGNDVNEQGRESANNEDCEILHDENFDWFADDSQDVALIKINDVWKFNNRSKWDTYHLVWNNCQDYAKELYKFFSEWKLVDYQRNYIKHPKAGSLFYFVRKQPTCNYTAKFRDNGKGFAEIACLYCHKFCTSLLIRDCEFQREIPTITQEIC